MGVQSTRNDVSHSEVGRDDDFSLSAKVSTVSVQYLIRPNLLMVYTVFHNWDLGIISRQCGGYSKKFTVHVQRWLVQGYVNGIYSSGTFMVCHIHPSIVIMSLKRGLE